MNSVALLAGVGDNRHLPSNPNYTQPYPSITYEEIAARAMRPPHAPLAKNSTDGIICANYTAWDLRKSNVGRDFSMQMLTVDFDNGNFTKQQVVDALNRALGGQCAFTVYSTFSAWTDIVDPTTGEITGNKGARWAAIIPLATGWNAKHFEAASNGFLDLIEAHGVKIEDRTSAEIKRIRFLPVWGAGGYDAHVQQGERFAPGPNHPFAQYAANRLAIADREDLERANRAAQFAEKGKVEGPRSSLAAYRRKHPTTPELMEWLGFSSIDGGRNWHHSSQSTNSYATELFDDGALYTLSNTVAAMGGRKAGQGHYFQDTYDIMCAVYHKGDRAAMQAYAEQCLKEEDAQPFGWNHMVALGHELWEAVCKEEAAYVENMLSSGIAAEPQAQENETGAPVVPSHMLLTCGEDGQLDVFGQTVAAVYNAQRKPNLMSAHISVIMAASAMLGGHYAGLDKDDRARGYILAIGESGSGKESAEKGAEKIIDKCIALTMNNPADVARVPVDLRNRFANLPGSAEGLQDRLLVTPDLVISVGEIAEHFRSIETGRAMHKAGTLNELLNVYSKADTYYQTRSLSKDEGATIAAPCVSLVATSTEDKLVEVLSEEFLKEGGGARFTMLSVDAYEEPVRKRSVELQLPQALLATVGKLTNAYFNRGPDARVSTPLRILWGDDVTDIFYSLAMQADKSPKGSLERALLNRSAIQAKWLSMVRAALNGTNVTAHIARWAVGVVEYSNAYKLHLVANRITTGEGDRVVRDIMDKLATAGTDIGGFPKWVERKHIANMRSARTLVDGSDRKLEDILEGLLKNLRIEKLEVPPSSGRGRPKVLYRINVEQG